MLEVRILYMLGGEEALEGAIRKLLGYDSVLFLFYLFFYFIFWLRWVFVAAHGLSLVVPSGGYSSLQCASFSLWWLLLLRNTGSMYAGFSSCGTRASVVVAHRLQ